MSLKLIIGNKNYSSWSLRPWIAMKVADIHFGEEVIPLYEPGSGEQIRQYSPTGKVPILIDGNQCIWESLAILEYLAEKFPRAQLWPGDAHARSHARVIASEMHAGFQSLRKACPMNMWLPPKTRPQTDEVMADVYRIDTLWNDCRARFGKEGPFLFGRFGIADAMYAPVVSRFHNYAINVSAVSHTYMNAMMALPAWKEWHGAALKESWIMKHNEPDWPLVRGVAVV
jgi:glutathione S-transferase